MKVDSLKRFRIAGVAASIALTGGLGLVGSPEVGATVTYNTWSSNESPNGNYILTVTDTGASNEFNWNLTVNPWNAEALGLFVDLGSATIATPVTLTNVNPTGQVSVFGTDTASDGCGNGCNLNGLSLPALVGGDWELVFSLADQGYDAIQTFSWTTPDFGLTESDFGLVGIRAQQLCTGTQATLPPNTGCTGSDKVYGYAETGSSSSSSSSSGSSSSGPPSGSSNGIPEPGTVSLLGIAMLGGLLMWRRQRAAA